MAPGTQGFYCLWQNERIRETLFDMLVKEDICSVRLANSACCNLVTKRLFLRTHLTFTASTFTRPSRIQALARIGHHIEHLTFYFAHSDATFLAPLIHPESGREISFLYTPHTSMASVLERPKFANSVLGQVLTDQYPPLFHAATNVPSFVNAMKHLPNLRHLTIKTPGQDAKERYRRDIVDYALISLRISIERAPVLKLNKLSLSGVHPSAFIYLRHAPGFGCTPSASRRWRQIRKLYISVESWDFYGPAPGLDHLKMIEDYVRNFSQSLDKFSFTWLGRKGPCPLSLAADPLFAPPRSCQKLFHEVTSPMSPLPPAPARKPVVFRKLRYLAMRNATMNAPQLADLVAAHQHSVREYDFDYTDLTAGTWDEALAPLLDEPSDKCRWSRHSTSTIGEQPHSIRPFGSPVAEDAEDAPTMPSAAVAALSDELLDMNMGQDDDDEGEATETPPPHEDDDDDELELPSDLEAARKTSLSLASKFKQRRITKRRFKRSKHSSEHHDTEDTQPQAEKERRRGRRRHRHKKSEDSIGEVQQQPRHHHGNSHLHQPSVDSLYSRPREPPTSAMSHYDSHPRLFGEVESAYVPSVMSTPRLFGEIASGASFSGSEPELIYNSQTDDTDSMLGGEESPYRPRTPTTPTTPTTITPLGRRISSRVSSSSGSKKMMPSMDISAPILSTAPSMPTLLQPTVYDPTADLCSEISAVQRDMEAEEAQRALAFEDADVQTSALKRAKERVLTRLGSTGGGYGHGRSAHDPGTTILTTLGSGVYQGPTPGSPRKESFGGAGGFFRSNSARLREGLFGRSVPAPPSSIATSMDHHRSMDVPILFSR